AGGNANRRSVAFSGMGESTCMSSTTATVRRVPAGGGANRNGSRALYAIIADRLDRAFFHGGGAGGFLGGAFGLVEDEAPALGVVPREVLGGRLAAEVAVDAGRVDVESARDVL